MCVSLSIRVQLTAHCVLFSFESIDCVMLLTMRKNTIDFDNNKSIISNNTPNFRLLHYKQNEERNSSFFRFETRIMHRFSHFENISESNEILIRKFSFETIKKVFFCCYWLISLGKMCRTIMVILKNWLICNAKLTLYTYYNVKKYFRPNRLSTIGNL